MYANFLTHFPPIEVIAYILYLCILVHTIYAIVLTTKNRKARPIGYAVTASDNATWQSKNMGFLGAILFLFIVIHMSDFWYRYKYSNTMTYKEYRTDLSSGQTQSVEFTPTSPDFENSIQTVNNFEIVRVKDLHARVQYSFSQLWYVIFYVIAMIAVAFHLLHGFQSAFRTLGWTHRKYTPIVEFIGTWFFAVIMPLGFALMPVVYYFAKS
jgi:succinate dehydrogenase / fumarate reductase cytochrome b subunit